MKLFEVTNTTWENLQIAKHKSVHMRSEWHWFVRCDLQIFSGCVCHLEQLHAQSPFLFPIVLGIKGEVRTINDRNICERRSCMKNNGRSPTFKFVSGEEKRPSEVQRVSWGWRLPGATHSSADLTWIRKWLEIQAPELSELEIVDLELGCCCSDLNKQVSDEICRTRKRQFEIQFRL